MISYLFTDKICCLELHYFESKCPFYNLFVTPQIFFVVCNAKMMQLWYTHMKFRIFRWHEQSIVPLNIYLSVLNDKSFKIKVISRPLKLAGKNRWKRIAWSMETDTWLGVCHSNSKSIPTMQYGPAADDTKWGFKSSQGYLKLDIFFSGFIRSDNSKLG